MNNNKYKESFIQMKKERRVHKRIDKRGIHIEDVIFIFEKVLEGWKSIQIYNAIIQTNPNSKIDKKKTEAIYTGNCRIDPSEATEEQFQYYTGLREKVYAYHNTEHKK